MPNPPGFRRHDRMRFSLLGNSGFIQATLLEWFSRDSDGMPWLPMGIDAVRASPESCAESRVDERIALQ